MAEVADEQRIDMGAAVTRSLLGWGVVAGLFYLIVGLAQALTAPRFDLARHPLSALMLRDIGWIQAANLVLTGLMVVAAAVGFARALRPGARATAVGVLIGGYGLCLILSAVFPPDPASGFPPESASGSFSTSGLLHLAFGAIGFLALGVAAFVFAGWARAQRDGAAMATWSIVAGVVVIAGFALGAATGTMTLGIIALWIAVLAQFAWLAAASVFTYRRVPHPDLARR